MNKGTKKISHSKKLTKKSSLKKPSKKLKHNNSKKSFKSNLNTYFNTFKLDNRFHRTLALDAAFFLTLFLGIIPLWQTLIEKLSASLEGLDLNAVQNSMNDELATETLALMQGFIVKSVLAILAILLIVFLLYTLTKSFIWKILLKKKFNKKYYYKSLVLNLVWGLLFLVVLLLTIFPALNAVHGLNTIRFFSLFFLVVLIYFKTLTFIKLAEKEKLKLAFKEVKNALNNQYKKPIQFIFVTFIAVYILSYLLSYLPSNAYMVISPIILLLFAAWARICIVDAIRK